MGKIWVAEKRGYYKGFGDQEWSALLGRGEQIRWYWD